ncbi:MAG: CBS domain-containing protein [Candidatus Andersenbacteria bacterium]
MATLSRITVRDLMTPNPLVVQAGTSLDQFVQAELLHRKQSGALVSERGRVIGDVGLEQVRRVPVQDLPTTTVGEVARRFHREELLKPSQPASRALAHLMANGAERLPVLDRGRLVGVLAREDVRVYLAVRTDLLNREPDRTRI